MTPVLFFLAAIGALAGAIGVVTLRNPFYSVLALVAHLVSLAVLFLLLRSEFVAAVQVVVYAGAVMVLYVFVVAYVGGEGEGIGERLRAGPAGGTGTGPSAAALRLGGARERRRRRRGLEDDEIPPRTPLDIAAPRSTGSMVEGVGSRMR